MGFGADLFSATTTFGASIFDIGSDLINSLDFLGHGAIGTISDSLLGHNANRTISDSLLKSFYLRHNLTTVEIFEEMSDADSRETYEVHQIWGALGIFIMFLPGIINIPSVLCYSMNGRNLFKETASSLDNTSSTKLNKVDEVVGATMFGVCGGCILLFYPIAMIFVSCVGLYNALRGKDSELLKILTVFVGQEAFFESFPQILLQCFTISYGYEVTTVQMVTIFASFCLLARVSIVYDLLGERLALRERNELTIKDTMIHTAKLFPAHVTTIMFRVSAFTLTMVFLREWAAIPIVALYLEILAITYIRFQSLTDPLLFFRTIWDKSLSNLAVLSVHSIVDKYMDKDGNSYEKKCRSFIILSTTTTFVHHVIVMTSIILFTLYCPEHFQHERFENLILKPGENHFFYAFGITYGLGISSLVFALHLSKRVLD